MSPRRSGLRGDFQNQVHELLAPEIFIGETANGLMKAERQGIIGAGQALVQHADILSTSPVFFPFRPHVTRALTIASSTRAGFYDCLAEQKQCELVTGDDRLVRNLQSRFPFIKSLSSLP